MADLEGTDERNASVAKDLFSGAMGGIAQVLLGMCLFTGIRHLWLRIGFTTSFFEVTGVSRASKNNGGFQS